MSFVVQPPPMPTLPVHGTQAVFPVRRIFCVGQNYADHAREMGNDPARQEPFFFAKPADALVPEGGVIAFPRATSNLHHEVEMVVALGWGGADIAPEDALSRVYGYGLGIDLTRRDLQQQAKEKGRPWDAAKGFDQSAPCSALRRASQIGHLQQGAISLKVNGQIRQAGNIAQMIFAVPELIARLSALFTLAPGDLIFTGTPSGVGPLHRGDRIDAELEQVGQLVLQLD